MTVLQASLDLFQRALVPESKMKEFKPLFTLDFYASTLVRSRIC